MVLSVSAVIGLDCMSQPTSYCGTKQLKRNYLPKDGSTVSSAEGKIMEFPLIWFTVDLEGPVGQRYKDFGL